MAATEDYMPYVLTPELLVYRDVDGWRYKQREPGDLMNGGFRPLSELRFHGPFASPEEAARHAAATVPMHREALRHFASMATSASGEMARFAATMHECMTRNADAPEP